MLLSDPSLIGVAQLLRPFELAKPDRSPVAHFNGVTPNQRLCLLSKAAMHRAIGFFGLAPQSTTPSQAAAPMRGRSGGQRLANAIGPPFRHRPKYIGL